MILKWIFDKSWALIGLLVLWPVLVVVAILIKMKMPGGPVLFVQKRVGGHAPFYLQKSIIIALIHYVLRHFGVLQGALLKDSELVCQNTEKNCSKKVWIV